MSEFKENTPPPASLLKPYQKPKLQKFGKVQEVTAGTSGPKNEPHSPLPRPQ